MRARRGLRERKALRVTALKVPRERWEPKGQWGLRVRLELEFRARRALLGQPALVAAHKER